MKKIIFSAALLLSLGLAGCSETANNEGTPTDENKLAEMPISDASNKETLSPITKEKYDQIKMGMTPEEVFAIIGSRGTVLYENKADDDSAESIIYKLNTDSDSSASEVVFEDGKLSYKAQLGLETTRLAVDLDQLSKLEKGMSKESVFKILGGKGAIVGESDVLEIYSYNDATSDALISLSFIDGKFKGKGEIKVNL